MSISALHFNFVIYLIEHLSFNCQSHRFTPGRSSWRYVLSGTRNVILQ